MYTESELLNMETIRHSWDGDELKIDGIGYRVWLVTKESAPFSGDYIIQVLDENGRWEQMSFSFKE